MTDRRDEGKVSAIPMVRNTCKDVKPDIWLHCGQPRISAKCQRATRRLARRRRDTRRLRCNPKLLYNQWSLPGAGMAELADAQDLGSCGRKVVEVQVLFPAPLLFSVSLDNPNDQ